MEARRIIIVGGVAGGASAATRLRRLDEDAHITIYERGPDVSFANCGLPYFLGGEITSRSKLNVQTPESLYLRFRLNIFTNTTVTGIDPINKLIQFQNSAGETGEDSFDDLVLSTGASPLTPPIPGIRQPNHFALRDLSDMDRIYDYVTKLKKRSESPRCVIVGAGYIGLEVAEQLSRQGVQITVVEALPQILSPFDPEMVSGVEELLRSRGIRLLLGSPVERFESDGTQSTVFTASGESARCDFVLLSLGVRPETTLAKEADIAIGALGGVVVDEFLETSIPHIWAIGDCIEVKNLVTNKPALIPLAGPANRQGRTVADNIIYGKKRTFDGALGTSILRLFDLQLACTGANEKTLIKHGIDYRSEYLHPASHASYYPGSASISMKLLFSPDGERILGFQAIGAAGVDKRVDVVATAMKLGAGLNDLADLELCYAPPFGSAKDPVNLAGMVGQNIVSKLIENVSPTGDFSHAFLLDVRDATEVAKGTIPNALHIPLPQLRERVGELPKDEEIIIYCQSGQRSYFACRILTQLGFRCKNMSGAYRSWTSAHPTSIGPR